MGFLGDPPLNAAWVAGPVVILEAYRSEVKRKSGFMSVYLHDLQLVRGS
jgi:hypothetical protein